MTTSNFPPNSKLYNLSRIVSKNCLAIKMLVFTQNFPLIYSFMIQLTTRLHETLWRVLEGMVTFIFPFIEKNCLGSRREKILFLQKETWYTPPCELSWSSEVTKTLANILSFYHEYGLFPQSSHKVVSHVSHDKCLKELD